MVSDCSLVENDEAASAQSQEFKVEWFFEVRRLISKDGVLRCWRWWLEGGRVRRGVKSSNNEPMKLTKPGIREPEAVAAGRKAGGTLVRSEVVAGGSGKKCVRKWANLGKGGCEIGKCCSFSHFETALSRLFPQLSTQVVDFPHLAVVRLFWEKGFHRRDAETQRQEEMGTKMGKAN
jgi:hypothetical protein